MKKCIECLEFKDESFFGKHKRYADGLRSNCKVCRNIRSRREYHKSFSENPDKIRNRIKKWRTKSSKYKEGQDRYYKNLRFNVLSHYSHGKMRCACCSESIYEFLSIDHIHGGGNRERKNNKRKGTSYYLHIIRSGFPPGLQVLCHNCNLAKGFYKRCPHQNGKN